MLQHKTNSVFVLFWRVPRGQRAAMAGLHPEADEADRRLRPRDVSRAGLLAHGRPREGHPGRLRHTVPPPMH
eukprot:scaffold596352_cov48-Prasinocladus_malaysianus.AAC.1